MADQPTDTWTGVGDPFRRPPAAWAGEGDTDEFPVLTDEIVAGYDRSAGRAVAGPAPTPKALPADDVIPSGDAEPADAPPADAVRVDAVRVDAVRVDAVPVDAVRVDVASTNAARHRAVEPAVVADVRPREHVRARAAASDVRTEPALDPDVRTNAPDPLTSTDVRTDAALAPDVRTDAPPPTVDAPDVRTDAALAPDVRTDAPPPAAAPGPPTVVDERPVPDRTHAPPPPPVATERARPLSALGFEVPSPITREVAGPRKAKPYRRPRSPRFALPVVVLLALLAGFFGWVSAEPFWLATGHGVTGRAVVLTCEAQGVGDRCLGQFAAPGARQATLVYISGLDDGQRRRGTVVSARVTGAGAEWAYVGTNRVLHVRWLVGLGIVLLCGLGVLVATVPWRLRTEGRGRVAGLVLLALLGPSLLAAGVGAGVILI